MSFVNVLIRFLLAPNMTALDVFEVIQIIEDGIDCHSTAVKQFTSQISEEQSKLNLRPVSVSAEYLATLKDLHIQKSSNNNIESNSALYSCYRQVHECSVKELEILGWEHDSEVFDSLQVFLVDQIQKRYAAYADIDERSIRKKTAEFNDNLSDKHAYTSGRVKTGIQASNDGRSDKNSDRQASGSLGRQNKDNIEKRSDMSEKKDSGKLLNQEISMVTPVKPDKPSNMATLSPVRKDSGSSGHKMLPQLPPVPVSDFKADQDQTAGSPTVQNRKPPVPIRKKKKRNHHHFGMIE
jgi:hypothetical protein